MKKVYVLIHKNKDDELDVQVFSDKETPTSKVMETMYGEDWEKNFIKECINDFKKKVPDYKYNNHVGLKDYLSGYGATKRSECFAEAFAEYFGGDNPRTFAKIFGKKLEKILKGVK